MKQKDLQTYRCMSKLCSLFCLETNKMNIKRNVTCEEPSSSTLQRFPIIRALKRFFLLVETWVSCTLINCFHCSAREIVLLDEQKIARTFSNDKRVSNFAGMENYIMVKQSGRWLNELNSRNTFSVYYAKFFRLLRFFDCMKTRAMSKFGNGI